jgi:Tfp pilus assembly protein PilN
MAVELNLLPEAYVAARRRDRWFQRGSALGLTLLMTELFVGLMLYVRAGDQRDLVAAIENTRLTSETMKLEMTAITTEAAAAKKSLLLADQLRATHHWSRLLAALASATPEGVMLTGIKTDPPKWTANPSTSGSFVIGKPPPKPGKKVDQIPSEPAIKKIEITGFAADQQGLSQIISNLYTSGLFASIDWKGMDRSQIEGREAVGFKLEGRW